MPDGCRSPETVAGVATAAEALGAAGATVDEARHPDGGHELTIEFRRDYGEGAAAERWRLLRRWDGFRSRMLVLRRDTTSSSALSSQARLASTAR